MRDRKKQETLEPSLLRIGLLGMEWATTLPGGLNRYLADLRRELVRQGASAPTIVSGPLCGAPAGVTAGGQMSDPIPLRLARYWLAARSLAGSVDVLDAHFALYALGPVLLGPLAQTPLVVHFQGPWAKESDVERLLGATGRAVRRTVERTVYHRAKEVVVLSAAFRQVLVESYGVSPWRVHVIPPGVDLTAFSPEEREHSRAGLGIGSDDVIVLAVRRLVSRMGLSVLLDAWSALPASPQRRLLAVAGEGPLRRKLEAQVDRLGIADQVRFLGRLDDVELAGWYRAANLSVVPSLSLEGFGLVVLESLASGTPALVSDAGGLPEALAGLDPSMVVPAGDPAALADRIGQALAGRIPDRADCRRHAESFSWEAAARANLAVYRRALNPCPPRGIRVVYLDHTARLSGGELALARLLPALQAVEAHVILAEDGPLVGRLLRAGISVEVLSMREAARGLSRDRVRPFGLPLGSAAASGTYVGRLALRLRRLRPDLVHTNSLKAALYGGLAARLAGVPCVWHVRDRIAKDYLPPSAVTAVRALGKHLPAAVIANSAATLATLSVPADRGHVVASPVELSLSTRPVSTGGPLRVGMVGRLASWKGQDVFLRAFALAFPAGSEQAWMVGAPLFEEDQDYAAGLPGLAERLGIASRLEFQGFVEDVGAELQSLDVLVHASVVPEPFGQVVVEGMAAGLAVVAAGAGGPAEVITDGVDGLLYCPGDVKALAAALRRLAGDPGLRQRLGAAGQAKAANFAPAQIAPQVVAVYRQVLGLAPGDRLWGR